MVLIFDGKSGVLYIGYIELYGATDFLLRSGIARRRENV